MVEFHLLNTNQYIQKHISGGKFKSLLFYLGKNLLINGELDFQKH